MPNERYRVRFNQSWPPILRVFLASIPPEGREMTSDELWLALNGIRGKWDLIPGRNAVVREIEALPGLLAEAGIEMERQRSATTRTIVFRRVASV